MLPHRHAREYVLLALLALLLLVPAPLLAQAQQDLVREGDSHFAAARYREALASYEKAKALAPGDVGILVRAAKSREALWDPNSKDPANTRLIATAAGEYREVLVQDPDAQEVLDRFVQASVNAGKRDDAYAFLKERTTKRPADARTLAWLSVVCAGAGKVDEQESWLRKLASVTPDDPEVHYTLGVLAWDRSYSNPGEKMDAARRRRILDAGMASLDRAVSLDPNYLEAMLYKNLLYREEAKVEPDPSKRAALTAKADEWQKKALETRRRLMEAPERAAPRPRTPLTPPPPPPPPPPRKKPGA